MLKLCLFFCTLLLLIFFTSNCAPGGSIYCDFSKKEGVKTTIKGDQIGGIEDEEDSMTATKTSARAAFFAALKELSPQKSETPKTIRKKRKITAMTEQQAGIKTEDRAMIEEEDEDLAKQESTD
jgi:hypothetical protein